MNFSSVASNLPLNGNVLVVKNNLMVTHTSIIDLNINKALIKYNRGISYILYNNYIIILSNTTSHSDYDLIIFDMYNKMAIDNNCFNNIRSMRIPNYGISCNELDDNICQHQFLKAIDNENYFVIIQNHTIFIRNDHSLFILNDSMEILHEVKGCKIKNISYNIQYLHLNSKCMIIREYGPIPNKQILYDTEIQDFVYLRRGAMVNGIYGNHITICEDDTFDLYNLEDNPKRTQLKKLMPTKIYNTL